MDELLKKILNNPQNRPVLRFLKINPSAATIYFQNWENTRSDYDEGGVALFDRFGRNIPGDCKYSLETHNIMIEPVTGEIFAFHTGRYSIFFKCDFEKFGLTNSDNYRKGYTFDCIADIIELGENWAFMDHFIGSEYEQLEWTYELMRKRMNYGKNIT